MVLDKLPCRVHYSSFVNEGSDDNNSCLVGYRWSVSYLSTLPICLLDEILAAYMVRNIGV